VTARDAQDALDRVAHGKGEVIAAATTHVALLEGT
jgi:hypothetical protein